MKKTDITRKMADYLDGDLPLEDRALYDAYLDQDGDAAQEIAELRQTVSWLRELPDPEPPPTLAADVMRRIRLGEADPGWRRSVRNFIAAFSLPRLAAPLAAAAALATVAVLRGDLILPGAIPDPGVEVASTPIVQSSPAAPSARPKRATPSPGALLAGTTATPVVRAQTVHPVRNVSSTDGPRMRQRTLMIAPTKTAPYLDQIVQMQVRRHNLDQRLDLMLEAPERFAALMRNESLAAQELWIKQLASRADERGIGTEVLAAFSESPPLAALGLKGAFETALTRGQPNVIATRSELQGR